MSHIFISHATADDTFVTALRQQLEAHNLTTWVDSRNLRGGDKLHSEITEAIEAARSFIVVLSKETIHSKGVRSEVRLALTAESAKQRQGYRVIPILLLPDMKPDGLWPWFGEEEPLAISIEAHFGALSEAMPDILAALGEREPEDREPSKLVDQPATDTLTLKVHQPQITDTGSGSKRASGLAQLTFEPHDATLRTIQSDLMPFTAPLGLIEMDDLDWYLEEYFRWPTGVGAIDDRKKRIEASLPQWGKAIFKAIFANPAAQTALNAWQLGNAAQLLFSVEVASVTQASSLSREAASTLLSLPWELLHDGSGYLFQGKRPLRVRRQIPTQDIIQRQPVDLPIRILLVSPRPEVQADGSRQKEQPVSYIDHRASALPLVKAVTALGEMATVTMLATPTLTALNEALKAASDAKTPYHVVHFDGHGVYDKRVGLGALCFEDERDADVIGKRRVKLVHANTLAERLRDYNVPLIFLDACQTAQSEIQPTASVAAQLLQRGTTSVVAMSHTVLVETATRFVTAFYRALAEGATVGMAMLAGQRALMDDSWRGHLIGGGDLRLQDWFVPVLYQDEDKQLFTRLMPDRVRYLQAQQRQLALGDVPERPEHDFVGRSRELLALERLLYLQNSTTQNYVVIRGTGGAGKTTLAAECARWLVQTGHFGRAAFVSLEEYSYDMGVLDRIGQQLLPGNDYSVALYGSDMAKALQPVERALRDTPTVIVLDNMESVLPLPTDTQQENTVPDSLTNTALNDILKLCTKLLAADPNTRILFTSREWLPAPFDHASRRVELGALRQTDAIKLVENVMRGQGWRPTASDAGNTPQAVHELVDAVGCHARALVLLAREIATAGIPATTENIQRIMVDLEAKHPGDRENSLFASVELSLRRLPKWMQEKVKRLAVVHGGGKIRLFAYIMDVEVDEAQAITLALIEVGVAEEKEYGYLSLDPALTAYWQHGMTSVELESLRQRWVSPMIVFLKFLSEKMSHDSQLAATLTLLEISNLRALLDWMTIILGTETPALTPERVVGVAGSIEQLLQHLGRPQALAHAIAVRELASTKMDSWNRAQFGNQQLTIERLLQSDDIPGAYQAAVLLQERALTAGEGAYIGADYDIAYIYWLLGRILSRYGQASAALPLLKDAQHRFECIATTRSNDSAARMVATTITEQADCLRALGKLEAAANAYEHVIELGKAHDDQRGVAVRQGQLAYVLMLQQRYDEALSNYAQVRLQFEVFSESQSVATVWHQMGIIHRKCNAYTKAEDAYRQALAIMVQTNNLVGQASSLTELGNLYNDTGRLEEAVAHYRQAAKIDAALQDIRNEGLNRNNIANTLVKLRRYDEARTEIIRAVECDQPFGHVAHPWKSWSILHKIEMAVGNIAAAQMAWQQARLAYLAYRRDGGDVQFSGGRLCERVLSALQVREEWIAEALTQLHQNSKTDTRLLLIDKLQAIVAGSRNKTLADDMALFYDDAAEILLLIEKLEPARNHGQSTSGQWFRRLTGR
ncbi:MAG: CHAT domain-containing protein [Chloroflexota bacterium]